MIYRRALLPNATIQDRKEIRKIDDDLFRYLNEQDESLTSIFEGGVSFEDNFDGVFVTFTSNAIANTEDTIAHTLGRAPVGFVVTDIDKAAVVYRTGVATAANILLKCDTASTTVTIFIF